MWARAVAPIAERVAQMLWSTARKARSESQLPARLTQRRRRTIRYDVDARSASVRECPGCGTQLKRRTTRCAACESNEATKRLVEAAARGRLLSQSPAAQARRVESSRRSARAQRDWNATDQPAWLTERFYAAEIQPRLRHITSSRLAVAVGLSQPYAVRIRSGKQRPHPRHWRTLAQLVGVTGGC